MAYSRFSHSDVFVFMSVHGHLECCGCKLGDKWAFDSTQAMVEHLAQHRNAGHDVPPGIEQDLWDDDHDNFVDLYALRSARMCGFRDWPERN